MPQPAGLPDSSGAVDRAPDAAPRPGERSDGPATQPTPLRPAGESHLERAIEEREFAPHFQPIVSLEDGEMLAAEALVRWQPSDEDAVPPARFIGLAEETGLIEPLGRQILGRAIRLLHRWGDAAPPRLHLNFGPTEFGGHGRLAAELRRAAREHDVHLGRLCVEISERQAKVSPGHVRRLRELGVRVALDDFGSGYAAYELLGSLSLTDLKLDASLVRGLESNRRQRVVVKRTVDLARDLGLRVIAEGVQTSAQLRRLQEAGCRLGQGFLFGRPQEPEAFGETLLASLPRRSNGGSGSAR